MSAGGNVGIGTTTPSEPLHVIGTARADDVVSPGTGSFGTGLIGGEPWHVRGQSANGPTAGYLGVQGETDFEGVANLDMPGYEIGVLGVSAGFSQDDNYGVFGHGSEAGVRGENANTPSDFAELGRAGIGGYGEASAFGFSGRGGNAGVRGESLNNPSDFGELGRNGTGVYASGSNFAGDFAGNVRVQGKLTQPATGTQNMMPVAYAVFQATSDGGTFFNNSGNVSIVSGNPPYVFEIV